MLGTISEEEFFRDYFEKKPLVIRRKNPQHYGDLLSIKALDHVLTTKVIQHPKCVIANASKEVKAPEYTYESGLIDVARLYQQFEAGGTIVFNNLEEMWPPLMDFTRGMERDVSMRFQCNIYMTPANAQGFPTHYDSHDVFVMQVHGTKHWLVYDTPIELPLKGQRFDRERDKPGEVTAEFDLEPGDMLYLPRGMMHDAQTRQGETLHITLGLLATTWTEVVLEAAAKVALGDPEFRRTLPPQYSRSDFNRKEAHVYFKHLLQKLIERADFDTALDHFADDLVGTRHALLEGQLEQVLKLGELSAESVVGARPNLLYRHRNDGEQWIVSCYGSDIRFPSHVQDTALFALENERYRISDMPGDLDDEGKVVLIKKFIREGLVRLWM